MAWLYSVIELIHQNAYQDECPDGIFAADGLIGLRIPVMKPAKICVIWWFGLCRLSLVVRKETILIRGIYMVVLERIFSGWFSERFCSSWKFSRRVFRSSGSGDGRVNVREDVSVRLRSVSWKFCRFL